MKNNLQIINHNNQLMLKKSKSLMSITNNILSKDDWMRNLWKWADENYVLEYCWYITDNDEGGFWGGLPRTKDALINLTKFVHCVHNENIIVPSTYNNQFKIPKEIGNLINLVEIEIWGYDSIEIPKEIENLINLKYLNLDLYGMDEVPREICNIPNLMSLTSDGEFTKLPKEIKNLTKLTAIQLSSYELTEVPYEICNFINLIKLRLSSSKLNKLPKEIKNLTELTILVLYSNELIDLPEELCELVNLTELSLGWNKLTKLPKKIGSLPHLTKLSLWGNQLTEFPEEIVNLTNLTKLDFKDNPNLILTEAQKAWIYELIKKGCDVTMDDRYENLYGEFELQRRYEYLEEFNIGREVPITPEILDNLIPYRITEKLAENEITFEEYLDEVSEYLDKDKFPKLIQKLYDRSFDLGVCFERNITFDTFQNDKLTWYSTADGDDKKILVACWGIINMFVKEIFGYETKIINISKKQELEEEI